MFGWYLVGGVFVSAILAWVYLSWDPFKRQIVHMHDEGEPCNYACGRRR